jgi:hypothetical protein
MVSLGSIPSTLQNIKVMIDIKKEFNNKIIFATNYKEAKLFFDLGYNVVVIEMYKSKYLSSIVHSYNNIINSLYFDSIDISKMHEIEKYSDNLDEFWSVFDNYIDYKYSFYHKLKQNNIKTPITVTSLKYYLSLGYNVLCKKKTELEMSFIIGSLNGIDPISIDELIPLSRNEIKYILENPYGHLPILDQLIHYSNKILI